MLSIAHQFLFIHIPKTAGNALQRALLPFSEDEIVLAAPGQDGIERFGIRSPNLDVSKHSTLAAYARQLPEGALDGLFKFTCVRNPWERCISHFFSPHRGRVEWSSTEFRRFVDEVIEPAQYYLSAADDEPAVSAFERMDAVIRFEYLERDFSSLVTTLGLGPTTLARINVSKKQDYRHYYRDDGLIEAVARKFSEEIEFFGYDFE